MWILTSFAVMYIIPTWLLEATSNKLSAIANVNNLINSNSPQPSTSTTTAAPESIEIVTDLPSSDEGMTLSGDISSGFVPPVIFATADDITPPVNVSTSATTLPNYWTLFYQYLGHLMNCVSPHNPFC